MKFTSIAIDGPSGAGKSTMARRVAEALGFLYVDTGAIYRSVSLYAYRAGADKTDSAKIVSLLPDIHIDMEHREDGLQHMILNGEDVSEAIRQNEVSLYTSSVAAIPEVRAFLLDLQRDLASTRNVIMDGRDIGTVVLPDATVKIYLTAAPEARAHRRWLELVEKGSDITEEQVLEDVIQRDYNDTHRDVAPLRQAEDAVLVDTSELDLEESFQLLLNTIRERI
jgi:cytidylate kinase